MADKRWCSQHSVAIWSRRNWRSQTIYIHSWGLFAWSGSKWCLFNLMRFSPLLKMATYISTIEIIACGLSAPLPIPHPQLQKPKHWQIKLTSVPWCGLELGWAGRTPPAPWDPQGLIPNSESTRTITSPIRKYKPPILFLICKCSFSAALTPPDLGRRISRSFRTSSVSKCRRFRTYWRRASLEVIRGEQARAIERTTRKVDVISDRYRVHTTKVAILLHPSHFNSLPAQHSQTPTVYPPRNPWILLQPPQECI